MSRLILYIALNVSWNIRLRQNRPIGLIVLNRPTIAVRLWYVRLCFVYSLMWMHPDVIPLFARVGVARPKSSEFSAHCLRTVNTLDSLINMLSDSDTLNEALDHISKQHSVIPGVRAEHMQVTITNRKSLFAYWQSVGRLIIAVNRSLTFRFRRVSSEGWEWACMLELHAISRFSGRPTSIFPVTNSGCQEHAHLTSLRITFGCGFKYIGYMFYKFNHVLSWENFTQSNLT